MIIKQCIKCFHLSAKLIDNDSDIDKAFRSMHDSIMRKIKNFVSRNCIVKIIVGHDIKILSVTLNKNNSIEKWR